MTNALGSTIALTDGTGTVQTEYTYDPFGMATVTGTSSTNSYQFTGRENDGTGLLYYRARYYSPVIQRFLSEDPIGIAGGDPNLYAYVLNNPTNLIDPSGLSFTWELYPVPGGYGGGFTVGQHGAGQWGDPSFVEVWVGHGVGGGASVWGPDNPAFDDGMAISAEIRGSGHIGFWGREISRQLGGYFPAKGQPRAFSKPDNNPSIEVTNKIAARFSAKVGIRIGFYGLGGNGSSGSGPGSDSGSGSDSGPGSDGGSGSSGGRK